MDHLVGFMHNDRLSNRHFMVRLVFAKAKFSKRFPERLTMVIGGAIERLS